MYRCVFATYLEWFKVIMKVMCFCSCVCVGEVIFEEYVLEYGTDRMEMHVGAVEAGDRALIVDDLIATGGTLCAAISLLGKLMLMTHLKLLKLIDAVYLVFKDS